MAQSLNTKVDLTISATSYLGIPNYGKILIGDNAFEYYNDKNVNDYIQIPWVEIDYISASVLFGKYINRFVIFTKKNGKYSFSAKNNKLLLRTMRKYISPNNMFKSDTFLKVVKIGFLSLFKRNKKH